MWHVEEEKKWKKASVALDESKLEKWLPKGAGGETKTGHAFYELVIKEGEVEESVGKKKISLELDYITAQMGKRPILVATTPSQFQNWSKAIIIAIPEKFQWKP